MPSAKNILLATPANISAIAAYDSFLAAAGVLAAQYDDAAQQAQPKGFDAHLLLGDPASTAISNLAGALAALKGTTTQSGSTFAPADQALYSEMERALNDNQRALIVMPYPANYDAGNKTVIETIQKVLQERNKAISGLKEKHKNDPKYDPLASDLKGIESALTSLLGLLTGANATGIVTGAALLNATTATYDLLTAANIAAGGSQRANTYFLLNVFVPAPHPSFNGGAVVAFTLRGNDGTYKSGGTLRLVYGFTKWRPPSLHKEGDSGYANFNWNPKTNNGGHIHISY